MCVGGRIWAINAQAGYHIDIIDPVTQQVQSYESAFPESPFDLKDVSFFRAGRHQSILFHTKKGETFQFDGQFRQIRSKASLKITDIINPRDSTVWLLGNRNWCAIRYNSGLSEHCDTFEIPQVEIASHLPEGVFMIGRSVSAGLYRLWFKKWGQPPQAAYQAPNGALVDLSGYSSVKVDRQQRLWLHRNGAIDIVESSSGRKVAGLNLRDILEKNGHEIDQYSIIRLYFDLNNLAWISTSRGIVVISIVENHFLPFLQGQNISTRGIAALDDHRVVTATYKGLKLIDLNQPGTWTDIPAMKFSAVGILYESPYLWMAVHEFSLVRYDMKTQRTHRYFFPPEDSRYEIYAGLSCYRDVQKRLWVGTEKGLLWLDEQRDTLLEWAPFHAYKGASDAMLNVRQFLENKEGLWIVTSRGLYLKPAGLDSVRAFEQFSSENIYHVYIDGDGIFWVSTRGGGMIRWDRQKNSVTRFTTAQGLSNNTVYTIYEDQSGLLWMSTNAGLNVFDKKKQTVQVFTARDGLPDNEFNFASHLKMPDGRMIFGGIEGLITFYPEKLPVNRTRDIPLSIWNIQRLDPVTGRLQDLLAAFNKNGEISLPYSENNMLIEFSLLDLFNPPGNRYYWQLEGVSTDRQYIHESYLRLNSLPYGSYKLRIGGIGSDGAVSIRELVIPVTVPAPYYMKPAFWVFMTLLAGGLFFGLIRLRTRQLRRAKAQLERQVADRTAHIEAQKVELEKLNSTKDQIFAILGHEMRGPVMQLQDFSEKVDYLVKKGETGRLKTLSDHFGQTIANVREILETLLSWGKLQSGRQVHRPQRFELQQVTNELFRQAGQLAELKNIHYYIDEQTPLYLFADPNAVSIILRNLLHNAMKFTPVGGNVSFTAKQSGQEQVIIEVSDSGIGMDEDLLAQINSGKPQESRSGTGGERGTGLGLSVCRDLVIQNGAQIEFRSNPGAGTLARIIFPVKTD